MRNYIGVVHQDDDSAFGLHFPDVAGCFAAADHLDDLLENARAALTLHLEDQPAPMARSMDQVRADPDVKRDQEDGAFLMVIPFVRFSGKSTRANITMDTGLLEAADITAKERGLTRSAFLATLVRREVIDQISE